MWPFSTEAKYTPLLGSGHVISSSRIARLVKVGFILSILAVIAVALSPLSPAQDYYKKYSLIPHSTAIPNIVHYVQIKPHADAKLDFRFAHFLSLYAAVLHIGASKVYIHTDYNATEIFEAGQKGSLWTRKVITTFPKLLIWNPVRVPEYAGTNERTRIEKIQHKTDFLRWDTITPIGGVYMDWDVVALRSLKPLLTSGFAFIGGRQYHNQTDDVDGSKGEMNNGIFMTRPNSLMATIMSREQSTNFAAEWSDNLKFMTRIAERLVAIPGEVLICDRNAFAPTTWREDSKKELFLPHGDSSPDPVPTDGADPMAKYEKLLENRRARRNWEWDFSSSYMLHAFGQSGYNEHITPKKILERKSNFGVAVWSVVKRMVEDGVITGKEHEW